MIKVLLVYPLEQQWYRYLKYQFASDDSITYYILGSKEVSNSAEGMITVNLGRDLRLSSKLLSRTFGKVAGLKNIVEKISPDIVISKELFSSVTYQVSRLRGNFKHVVWCDEVTSPRISLYGKFPISRFYFEYNRKRARYFLFISNKSKEMLSPYCKEARRILVVYPGVDNFLDKLKKEKDNKEFSFLFVGNIAENKGIKTMLNSIELLSEKTDKKFVLKIAGKGPLADLVQSTARGSDFVRYLGYVTELEKANLLRESDAFIYPAEDINFLWLKRWEEQGAISAIEAMAAGLPVIGSDSGSLPEIIRNDKMLFKQGNPYSLTEKMKMLLENTECGKEIGENNFIWSRANCNGPEQSKKVNEFLISLLT